MPGLNLYLTSSARITRVTEYKDDINVDPYEISKKILWIIMLIEMSVKTLELVETEKLFLMMTTIILLNLIIHKITVEEEDRML